MNWITNAATEIAAGIVLDAEITNSCDGIASIISRHTAPLVALLRESKRECIGPFCIRGYTSAQPQCTCGADAWNARLDEVLNATP